MVLGGSASAATFNLICGQHCRQLFSYFHKNNNTFVFSQSCGIDMGDLYVVTEGFENNIGTRKVGLFNDYGFVRRVSDLIQGR